MKPRYANWSRGTGQEAYGSLEEVGGGRRWEPGHGQGSPSHVYGSTGGYAPIVSVTNSLGLVIYATGPAISVVPLPTLNGSSLSKTNLVFTGINAIAGRTNYALMSTNLTLPRSQWTPMATNLWSGNGSFTFTVTNVVSPSVPKRFYMLQVP